MTLGEIRDWLKTLDVAENCYIGRLDNKKERSLGVYSRSRKGEPAVALGGMGLTSYGVRSVSLLLHWDRNARETESAAMALWEELLCAAHVDLPGGGHIQCVRMTVPEPVAVGTDKDGVYEYVVEADIYYRR